MDISRFKHGCEKAPESLKDHLFAAPPLSGDLQPVDLRPECPPVRDQGDIGSCTAFGATELYDFVRRKHGLPRWAPSPLFTYYATRMFTNDTDKDCGAAVVTAIQSTVKHGVAMERDWPYDTTMFAVKPLSAVWEAAERHQTLEYLKIDDYSKHAFVGCLMEGYPFAFGMRLFHSFFSTGSDGIVKLPDFNTEKLVGGHCMLAVGYKIINDQEYIIVQNSWGKKWGDGGCCYVPMAYMLSNFSYDYWTIRLTETCDTDTPDPEPTPAPEPEPVVVVTPVTPAAVIVPPISAAPVIEPVVTVVPVLSAEPIVPPIGPVINIWPKFYIGAGCMLLIVIAYYFLSK